MTRHQVEHMRDVALSNMHDWWREMVAKDDVVLQTNDLWDVTAEFHCACVRHLTTLAPAADHFFRPDMILQALAALKQSAMDDHRDGAIIRRAIALIEAAAVGKGGAA